MRRRSSGGAPADACALSRTRGGAAERRAEPHDAAYVGQLALVSLQEFQLSYGCDVVGQKGLITAVRSSPKIAIKGTNASSRSVFDAWRHPPTSSGEKRPEIALFSRRFGGHPPLRLLQRLPVLSSHNDDKSRNRMPIGSNPNGCFHRECRGGCQYRGWLVPKRTKEPLNKSPFPPAGRHSGESRNLHCWVFGFRPAPE